LLRNATPTPLLAAPAGHRNAFDRAGRRNVFAFISVVRLQVDKAFGAVFRTLRLHSRQLIVLDHIALAPRRCFHQVCAVSCTACSGLVFAGFGLSALRFIVAVITVLAFVLALDLDVVPDTCGGSADEAEAIANALFGTCSGILPDRIKAIARAFNRGRPSGQP
jgi:hypothetical protein